VAFDGGIAITASASPHVVPAPWSAAEAVDPEEMLVAAIADCHIDHSDPQVPADLNRCQTQCVLCQHQIAHLIHQFAHTRIDGGYGHRFLTQAGIGTGDDIGQFHGTSSPQKNTKPGSFWPL
jgi:hypothetical protein